MISSIGIGGLICRLGFSVGFVVACDSLGATQGVGADGADARSAKEALSSVFPEPYCRSVVSRQSVSASLTERYIAEGGKEVIGLSANFSGHLLPDDPIFELPITFLIKLQEINGNLFLWQNGDTSTLLWKRIGVKEGDVYDGPRYFWMDAGPIRVEEVGWDFVFNGIVYHNCVEYVHEVEENDISRKIAEQPNLYSSDMTIFAHERICDGIGVAMLAGMTTTDFSCPAE